MEIALIVHVPDAASKAALNQLALSGLGPLVGDLPGYGDAMAAKRDRPGLFAFAPPADPNALEWLHRCRGYLIGRFFFSVTGIHRDEFEWFGEGADAATKDGLRTRDLTLPEMPAAWRAFFGSRPGTRALGDAS